MTSTVCPTMVEHSIKKDFRVILVLEKSFVKNGKIDESIVLCHFPFLQSNAIQNQESTFI